MLIPSIDLMAGKIVQLVQGEKKALEFDEFDPWLTRFSKYPLVQLIDLDAAKRQGDNTELVEQFCGRLPCQVGGGVRTIERAKELLQRGARAVIIGSSLIKDDAPDTAFASALAAKLGIDRLVFAVDSRNGKVVVSGWREATSITPMKMMRALNDYCAAFLYTNVETEGLMQGFPMTLIPDLQKATTKRLIVAGGIHTMREIETLDALGIEAVVGMAIYTGMIDA